MSRLPKPLTDVVEELARLPGLGPKSALRVAMTLLQWPKDRAVDLGQRIRDLRERLCLCSRCRGLSEFPVCPLCSDPTRGEEELCLVSQWDSVLVLEETGQYRGRYFVLGGLLDPLEGVSAGSLAFGQLSERLGEGKVREVLLALGTTVQAEATASHIKNMVARDHPGIRLTRLAQGIPLGAEVKYVDRETLRQSVRYRQDV
ncbi:MAG: recombination mediator RecR [Thermodesulfobacteriota bacterium]|nr:recombination protein RecR [Desulfovibrio sp.]